MGRKRIPDELRKEKITIALPKWMIDKLKQKDNYNKFIFEVLSVHIKDDSYFDEK